MFLSKQIEIVPVPDMSIGIVLLTIDKFQGVVMYAEDPEDCRAAEKLLWLQQQNFNLSHLHVVVLTDNIELTYKASLKADVVSPTKLTPGEVIEQVMVCLH
jgi:hypothetical protein